MPSIRKNLFIWLLLGLSLLWAIAGVVIYLSVRQGEIAKIDSELQRMEGALRFIGGSSFRNPGGLLSRLPPTREAAGRRGGQARWQHGAEAEGAEAATPQRR